MPVRLLALAGVLLGFARRPVEAAGEPAQDYSLREWHPADGLPSEETSRIIQGRDGYLWVLTSGGLARFDGAQFEPRVPLDAAGRRMSVTRALVETETHGLVLAPVSGGLLAWRDGKFSPVALPAEAAARVFNALFVAPDGALWGGGEDGVVMRWQGDRAESYQTKDALNGRPVYSFASDGQGRVWVANGTSLARYENGRLVPCGEGLGGSELRIGSSPVDGPWIATQDRLVKFIEGRLEPQVALPALMSAHYIQTLLEDRAGALWIGTRSQGVHLVAHGAITAVATSHEDILSVNEDSEGNLWVATNGGGLNRLRPRIFRLYDKSAGLRDNFSDTICEANDGTMWFGNRDGGVARVRGEAIEFVPPPAAWPVISAVSVAPHPQGGIWATAGPGLFRIAEKPVPVMEQVLFPTVPIIRCTYVTRGGVLWFSADPDRLGRVVDGKVDFVGREAGFDGKQTRFITEDAAGKIWCATADGRLFRQAGERFERVPLEITTGIINGIHVDAAGDVWLCTAESGLVVRRAGQWRVLSLGRGLPDNNLTQMLDDGRGNFWFGSGRGIFRASRQDLITCLEQPAARVHAILLGKDEGLKDVACLGFFQPAAWKSRDGKLWFATRRGVLRIDPTLAIPDAAPPPVQIRELRSDERALVPGAQLLRLDPMLHKLEIRFSVLCLATPERVRARYRLDGFDGDWVVAGTSRVATYPRLPPGRYQFHVQAGLGDGSADTQEATLDFFVVPPWWQTWWFRAAATVLLVVAVGLGVRGWSHRRLRAKLERLERETAVERERARIARNIHDDLGAGLTRISLLTQSVGQSAAGAAQFERIYTTVNELTRSMDEIVWAVNPKYDDLDNLAYYLGNFAQGFLADAGVRCRLLVPGVLPPHPLTSQMRHHLFLCCKEALNNIVKHARATEVSLAIAVEAGDLNITITDNGCGCSGTAASELKIAPRVNSGNGIANLRARMAELGGRCEIVAAPGGGTVVTFAVTLPRTPSAP